MITYTNSINMYTGSIPLVIHVNQYDSDFTLVFNLYSSAGAFTVESGTTASIRGTKTDGNGYTANATIDISNRRVTVAGHVQMTATAGRNVYELVLTKSNKDIATANFILDCEPAAMDADTIQSETVLKELNAIIESAQTAEEAAERAEEAAEHLTIDTTLTQSGQAADAKVVGDELDDIKSDLNDLVDELSTDVDLYTTVPAIGTILFTLSDVAVGETITYSIVMPAAGGKTGYIGLYDASDNRLAYYGRGAGADPTTNFDGTFEIPATFSYAKWYGSGTPVSLSITKKVFSTGAVHYDTAQTLTDEQKTTAQTNIGVESVPDMYEYLKDAMAETSGEIDLSNWPEKSGFLTGNNTWSVEGNTTHIVIPVQVGEEITIEAQPDLGCYYAFFTSYTTPVNGASASVVSEYGRTLVAKNTTAKVTVPSGAVYLYISKYSGYYLNYPKTVIVPSYSTDETLKDQLDKIEHVPEMYDFLKDSLGNSTGEVDISDYSRIVGWLTDTNKWAEWNFDVTAHCLIPVVVGEEIVLKTNTDRGVYIALFTSDAIPVADASAPIVSGWGREYVQPNTTKTFTVPSGAVYLYFGLNSGSGADFSAKSLTIPSAITSSTLDDVIDDAIYDDGIASVTLASPVTILSSRDAEVTSLDNGWLNYFNIIQVSESMYYMYYGAVAQSALGQAYNANLLFAYSTDGIHYTRGFPSGITPPFAGTNKVFSSNNPDNIDSQSVFKCGDPDYPFRLICQQKEENIGHYINMYKSVDGIHFDLSTKRTLRKEYHDNQICVIPRGNILKIYFRENSDVIISGVTHHNRHLGVMFFDLDGNLLSPSKDLSLQFVYNSAATAINDVEEIIFPTNFDNTGGSQAYSVDVYRVDKYHLTPVQSNLGSYFTTSDKFVLFAPNFITINNEQYIAFKSQNINHDDWDTSDPPTRTATYKLAKITMSF